MELLYYLRNAVANLFKRRRMNDDLEEELKHHLTMAEKSNLETGMSPTEARRAARVEFGSVEKLREESRDAWGVRTVTNLVCDIRFVFRQLIKNPGFAAVAILTLALGIGTSTTLFSALRAFVLDPFDYPSSERLVQVWTGEDWSLSEPDYLDLREQSTSFEEFGAYRAHSFNLGIENTEAVGGVTCTNGVLRALGVPPLHGRWFGADDDNYGASRVAIISYRLWQRAFGGDQNVLDSVIRLNGAPTTVVGIMPRHFEFIAAGLGTQSCDVWLPLHMRPDFLRGSYYHIGLGRLRAGVTVEAADTEIKAIGQRITALHPDSNPYKRFLVRSLRFEMTREISSPAWFGFTAAALVLLLACANVASMLLARGAQREGEFGLRIALGATGRDLRRLVLVESIAFSALGAVVGLIIAYGGIEILKNIAPASGARKAAIRLDVAVMLFALAATLLTSLVAGLVPALTASRSSILSGLPRGTVRSSMRIPMLRVLVVAQVAVVFMLANSAALFSASYLKLREENSTFATEDVLTTKLTLNSARYVLNENRIQFWQQIVERLQRVPGVIAVGITSKLPFEDRDGTSCLINDEAYDPDEQGILIDRSSITADFFKTMGLAILQGRNLRPEDEMNETGICGVVINRAMADLAWPEQDPIGQIIRGNNPGTPWFTATVVGVVQNVKNRGAASAVEPEMYTTPLGHFGTKMHLNVRTNRDATFLAPLIRSEIESLDSDLALQNIRTLQQVVRDATQSHRSVAGLIDFFTVTALALTAIGLYGTLSYHILRRTREIGLRMAVGALRADIIKLVVSQGARWVAVGVAIGLVGTVAVSSLWTKVIYGVEGITALPVIFAIGAVALATLSACWLSAWRASRLSPLEALYGD